MKNYGLAIATAFLFSATASAIEIHPPSVISPTTSPTVPVPGTPEATPAQSSIPAAAPPPPYVRRGQFYIHIGGGVSFTESSDVELTIVTNQGSATLTDIDIDYDTGIGGKVGFGYRGANGLGFELLGEYGQTEVDAIEGFAAIGDVDYYSAIASIYFSPSAGIVEPKISGGIGVMHAEWTGVQTGSVVFFDDDATGLALEGHAGLLFRAAPNFALGPIYRYRYVMDVPADDALTTMHIAELGVQIGF